jgi:hypothetical protein
MHAARLPADLARSRRRAPLPPPRSQSDPRRIEDGCRRSAGEPVRSWLLGPSFVDSAGRATDGSFHLDLVPPSRAEVILKNPATLSSELLYPAARWFVRAARRRFVVLLRQLRASPCPGIAACASTAWATRPSLCSARSTGASDGWWNATSHRALVDAALRRRRDARGSWIGSRKNSGKQLADRRSQAESLGGKQIVGHPERPLYFDGAPGDVSITVEAGLDA